MDKTIVTIHSFVEAMKDWTDKFSHESLVAMFDYIANNERATGDDWEFNPYKLSQLFHQYETIEQAEKDNFDYYGWDAATWIQLPSGGYLIYCDF